MSRRAPRKPRQVKRSSYRKVIRYWLKHTDFTEQELREHFTEDALRARLTSKEIENA